MYSSDSESSSIRNLAQRNGHQTLNSIMASKKNPSTVFKPPFGTSPEEHHTRLGKHANRLWRYSKMTDLTVELEGSQYPCHKTVVSCYSKYFRQCLSEQKETVNVINLKFSSVSKESFEVLLTYMYTSELNLTCQNIGEVYTAARKLGVDGAIILCTRILSGKSKHDVYSVYVYVTAKKQILEDCAAKALRIMTRRFEHIVGTPEFLDLDFFQVHEYLTQDVLATRSEVIVYLAVLKWLSVKFLEREEYAADLIGCVRFSMMTLNEILACFSPPLLPGILELKEIRDNMLEATCFVAASLINEEKRFERYSCRPRKYLLKREPVLFWDPSIFDPDRYEIYRKEMAATRIQSVFRGYKVRKSIQDDIDASLKENNRNSADSSMDGELPGNNPRNEYEDNPTEKNHKNNPSETDENDEDNTSSRKMSGLSRSSSMETFVTRVNDLAESTEIKAYNSDSATDMIAEIYQRTPRKHETIHKIYTMQNDGYDEEHCEKSSDENITSKRIAEGYILPPEKSSSSPSEENMVNRLNFVGYILVAGGFRTDDVEDDFDDKTMLIYNVAKNKWKRYGTMLEARHHHCLVHLDDKVYFIGGCNPEKNKSGRMIPDNKCFKLNLESRKWTEIKKMKHSRMYHGAAEIHGKIYVVGGKDNTDRLLRSVEVYNPRTDEWEELDENLETPTMGIGVCAHREMIWIIGGMAQEKDGTLRLLNEVKCYDPDERRWSHIRQLPSSRAFSTVTSFENDIYVIGGTSENEQSSKGQFISISEVLIYNKEEKRWVLAASLPFPRHFVNATVIGSNLYILGGLTSYSRETISDVIVYDKKTERWHSGSSLPVPLCGFASVSILKASLK